MCLEFEAAMNPPLSAGFLANPPNPPVETLEHSEVRVTPMWQETLESYACMIQGRVMSGTHMRMDSFVSCLEERLLVALGAGGGNVRTRKRVSSSPWNS